MATKGSGTISNHKESQDTLIVDTQSQPGNRDVKERDRDALATVYKTTQQQERSEHKDKLDKELKALAKISDRYESQFQQASRDEGLDLDRMETELKSISNIQDDNERQNKIKGFHDTYASSLIRVVDRAGVDRVAAKREAADIVTVPAHAKRFKDRLSPTGGARVLALRGDYDEGLIGDGWYNDPPVPLPAPPPQYTRVERVAPYEMNAFLGDGAWSRSATGEFGDYNQTWVGSTQHLASVGSTFFADKSIRRVRVEATVNLPYYYTVIGAIFGYASAELLLNLKVLNGTQVVGSNRLSLLRQWGVVFWVTSQSGGGTYTLACEFNHSYGTPRTYAAIGELETWTGGGGTLIVSPATASGFGTNQKLVVTLIR
jgi:hypothetical protein